ncbi:hypothetical protein [Streptomyces griseorubiginosus]|nr:hypothetical protein [Streptomyces griseorubiginosus]
MDGVVNPYHEGKTRQPPPALQGRTTPMSFESGGPVRARDLLDI